MPKTSVWRQLSGWVFPVFCLGCDREGEWWCRDCARTLAVSHPERCAICRRAGLDGICDRCRTQTKLDGVVALFDYHDPPVAALIKRVKYGGHSDGLLFLAEHYRRVIIQRLPREDFVATFVSLDRARQAQRGFNQAELLASRTVGSLFPVQSLLIKKRLTTPQASLNRSARLTNQKRTFAVTSKSVPEAVVIFDDVVTTGTTLSEAAKVMKKAGARTVWAVTIAHD